MTSNSLQLFGLPVGKRVRKVMHIDWINNYVIEKTFMKAVRLNVSCRRVIACVVYSYIKLLVTVLLHSSTVERLERPKTRRLSVFALLYSLIIVIVPLREEGRD